MVEALGPSHPTSRANAYTISQLRKNFSAKLSTQ